MNNLTRKVRDEYLALEERQELERKELPIFWAFGDKQFDENYAKYLEKYPEAVGKEIFSWGSGGYGIKIHLDYINDLLNRQRQERNNFIDKHPEILEALFNREMWNIEYGFNEDDQRITVDVLGKNFEDLTEAELEAYIRARKDYMRVFYREDEEDSDTGLENVKELNLHDIAD